MIGICLVLVFDFAPVVLMASGSLIYLSVSFLPEVREHLRLTKGMNRLVVGGVGCH